MALMPQMEPDGDEGAAPQKPQVQPSGQSPASQPSVNNGEQAAAQAMLAPLVRQMEMILPKLGSGSDAGGALLKAISSLSKFAAPSEASPGIAMNAAQSMADKMRQQMPLIAALRAQQGGAPQGAPSPMQQQPPQ